MKVRRVEVNDLPIIAEMMHRALEPFYGGDHRAHAKRIVETSVNPNIPRPSEAGFLSRKS